MDTSNPLGPAPLTNLPRGAGGGIALAGYKTYGVAVLSAVIGGWLVKAHGHIPGGVDSWLLANQDAIAAWVFAAALAAGRGAVAKVQDYLHAVHGAPPVPTTQATPSKLR